MATADVQDPTTGGDWWSQNAPPPTRITGPITDASDPRLSDPSYASDPNVLDWINKDLAAKQVAAGNAGTPNTPEWQAYIDAAMPKATSTGTTETGTTGPIVTPGLPTTGFGAAPPTYASDPNAPTFEPLPPYVAPTWTGGDYVPPSVQDLQNAPGYQARMDAVLKTRNRSAAAQGTVLNGGTLVALDRDAQNFASNEYQTLNANTLDAYKTRYAQFTDAAGRDLASRTVNANANQSTYANRTSAYTAGNARTLSDYLTNVTSRRNAELDYWNRLQDLNRTGSDLAGNSR